LFQSGDPRIPDEFIHKKSNASFLLNENENFGEFFITNQINLPKDEFLTHRLAEIKMAENDFVTKIGLIYYDE